MTITVAEVGPGAAGEWDAFVSGHPGASIYHRHLWHDLLPAEFGCESHYLLARDATGHVAGVLPLVRLRSALFGDFMVSVPYFNYGGSLARDESGDVALMAAAGELAGRLGVGHVEFRDRSPRTGLPVRTDKVAMVLPLETDPAAQWQALGSKLRAQVKRPQREGVVARFGGTELLGDFYRVFSRNMRDLGTPVYAATFFGRILGALPGEAELAVVYAGGVPAAAGFLMHHGGTTEIPWASSLREWNRIGTNMFLYWEIIQRAIARGSREFDFGRSTVDAGTYRFKAQWGARPRPLWWHYWLPAGRALPGLNPSNPRFALAIRMWQRLPVGVANLIGPRIVRWLP